MALDRQKLYDGLISAYEKGRETKAVSGGEDGEVESVHDKGDVAGFIADAIVSYASDAEIMLLTGPFLIPAAPSPIPDPANMGQIDRRLPPEEARLDRQIQYLGAQGCWLPYHLCGLWRCLPKPS